MTSLAADLSRAVEDAFAAEGLDRRFGQVQVSDRPDLAQYQCNGALAAAKEAKANPRAIAEKIAARLEVLEGYLAVYLNLDKVIKIIRTEDEPKPKLMKAFSLTDNQAEAILNMRLRALRKLEEMEIRGEHASLTKERKELTKLLGSDKQMSEMLIEQVKEIDAKFGGKTQLGKRRTEIAGARDVITGQPADIASSTGRPNPSYNDGNANPCAPAYSNGNSFSAI